MKSKFSPNRLIVCLLILSAAISLGGCSKIKKVVSFDSYVNLTVKASSDVNPDQLGRASPINIKLYVLSERTTYDNLGFEGAFDQAKTLLSGELVTAKEYIFQPNEKKHYRIKIGEKTKFIALVAAYRNVDHAKWKLAFPVEAGKNQYQVIRLTSTSALLEKPENQKDPDDVIKVIDKQPGDFNWKETDD